MPAGIEPVGQPRCADRFGQDLFALLNLGAGFVIRNLGHRHGGDSGSAALPESGDAEEIRVEACPGIVAQLQDDAAGRQVIGGPTGAEFASFEDRGEEGEVGFDERSEIQGGVGGGFWSRSGSGPKHAEAYRKPEPGDGEGMTEGVHDGVGKVGNGVRSL